MTLKASEQGKQIIKTRRETLGWTYNDPQWLKAASQILDPDWPEDLFFDGKYPNGISEGTLKRFQGGKKPIDSQVFKIYCHVLNLPWEDIAESCFVGRNKIVNELLNNLQTTHKLLLLTGITGTGKTALANKLMSKFPKEYQQLTFSFETSEQEPNFASVATQIIANLQKAILPSQTNQPENIIIWLVDYISNHECVLLIDSLEFALQGDQHTGWSNFKDIWWEKFFLAFMAAPNCQGKIIITSQEMPIPLEDILISYNSLCEHQLLQGFTDVEIYEFFHKQEIGFTENSEIGNYLLRIGKAYEGHPLALKTIAGEILNTPFSGDVNKYWCEYKNEIAAIEQAYKEIELESINDNLKLDCYSKRLREIVKQRIENTFQRLEKYVPNAYKLLCFGSIYRRAVPKRFWFKNLSLRYGLNIQDQEIALDALIDRYLVENINNDLRQHNLIRSTALEHLRTYI
ncbi:MULTISPECIES: ATP-binding protein [unclassified Anabaena]|uniref:ATP-binding protein n=1 Tax=unclassified Anabaena TaxID=2619674 RepID=UPI0014475EF4|nr:MULTISPECIES: ATP-binding protein [unclassified Anabaena]MTJ09821.1 ATP-binding protein [Anabaena sp. UHCC 0204]MTJ53354.1 ATP-binding protein [Anabaena sp. UHCC 0253]